MFLSNLKGLNIIYEYEVLILGRIVCVIFEWIFVWEGKIYFNIWVKFFMLKG